MASFDFPNASGYVNNTKDWNPTTMVSVEKRGLSLVITYVSGREDVIPYANEADRNTDYASLIALF